MQPQATTKRAARRWQIKHADCLQALPALDAESIDAVVTDPPYGINISGLAWDRPNKLDPAHKPGRRAKRADPGRSFQAFSAQWASECLRVLKPGAHLAAFAAPRTFHLLTLGLEEAGFEIRDVLMWIQGQGYPATSVLPDGLGTGLKPAWEPIVLARKPVGDTTLKQNLARHRTGALNIDACRIPLTRTDCPSEGRSHGRRITASQKGRWPANLLISHGHACTRGRCEEDCPAGMLGERHRFFYAAKAPRRERDAGCQHLPRQVVQTYKIGAHHEQQCAENPVANIHPTVKPIELMRWLTRLITPAGGLVLDPFAGSGSTGAAAAMEGARFIGIEREADYVPIARARVRHWSRVAARSR